MKKRILINAIHPEEKRVAIIEGEKLVDFYVEASGKEHLRGNIYKGTVVRVEPGLQAAFVDFGQKKQGFLQLREIKKEFFQKDKEEGRRARIQDVISKGQELIVQVEKDERDNKGASLTTFISLPGRYIVMMPGEDKVGVSRKIEAREDRQRIKEVFNALKLPKNMGFILRTACSDKTGEELDHDLQYLTKLWNRIKVESKKVKSPALIYKEQDIAVRTVRDYLTSDVAEVLIDDPAACKITKDFLKKTTPWLKINIKLYKDKRPIFAAHNIEEQIAKINERNVYLPSRGYIVIDKTEALTAIDVNSGRSRKEEHVEGTALRTNIEAAEEIARQLRLRDIGGLVVIDFIDMESSKNRREVERRLKEVLSDDKAHTETGPISKFGLVEMTRERLRTSFLEAVNKRCETCGGTGVVKSDEAIAVTAFRSIHARAAKGGLKTMTCTLPVESLNYILGNKIEELASMEKEYGIRIVIAADRKLAGEFVLDAEKTEEEKKAEAEARAEQPESPQHKQRGRGEHPRREKESARPPRHAAPHKRPGHEKETDADDGIDLQENSGPDESGEDDVVPGTPPGGPEQDREGAEAAAAPEGDGTTAVQRKRRSRGRFRRRGRGKRGNKPLAEGQTESENTGEGEGPKEQPDA